MSIWTLVVNGDEVSVDLYDSEAALYDDLRAGWYVPESIENDGVLAWLDGEYHTAEFHVSEHPSPTDPVVPRVVKLWNDEGGWIPGCSYGRLADLLGVEHDALTHYKPGIGRHYPAADHSNGGLK